MINYCVIKDTTTIIDGSGNSTEVMLRNAQKVGLTEAEVEILTAEEYQQRLASIPQPTQPPTDKERIESLEAAMLALLEV
jgi:hypothetical protein